MSQKSVEILLGKLVTDEELRHLFQADPAGALRQTGLELTGVEVEALRSVAPWALDNLARSLDPRLQKASLHNLDPKETGK
jgi:putative modified peptide